MSVASAHRSVYEIHLQLQGQTVFIHSNFGTPEMQSFETRGLKEAAANNRRQVVFQFPEQIEAYPGDVVQIKGSRDYWKIVDTEDLIEDDQYIYMEVWVEKINEQGRNVRLNEQGRAVFTGNNYGILQMGGQGNTQTAAITNTTSNSDFDKAIAEILQIIHSSTIPKEDKEEFKNDVKAINNLALKAPSSELAERAKSRGCKNFCVIQIL